MSEENARYRPRVLVVEDNYILATTLSDILEECGCDAVGLCPTVKEANHLIEQEQMDVAIIDYLLEDGSADGLGLLLDRKAIPYAFLTGASPLHLRASFPNTPILMKPYTADDVQDLVDRLMAAKLKG